MIRSKFPPVPTLFRHFLRSKKYPIGSVSVVDDVVVGDVGVSTKTRDPR